MQALTLFQRSENGLARVLISQDEIKNVYTAFKNCEIANAAVQAILNEIALCEMTWGIGDDESDPVVEQEWNTFTRHAVTQVLVAGFVVWKKMPPKNGATTARVLQPSEFTAHYDERYRLKVTETGDTIRTKCNTEICYAPDFDTGELTSPAKRAMKLSKRYAQITDNFMKRDATNSEPSVYTTVSKDLSSAQDTTTWFSPRNRAGIHDRDFNALVAQRQRAIHELTAMSKKRRVDESGVEKMMHKEYIVSDGQTPMEMSALQGQNNERALRDQTATAIMKCYNVDPQVMGQNVNSERAGLGLGSSSHAMTTRAINNFDAMVDRYIAFVNKVLQLASKTPAGASLRIKRPLKESVVQKVAMLLEPTALIAHYARIYKIDPRDFSTDRIKSMQEPDRKQKRTAIEMEQNAQES